MLDDENKPEFWEVNFGEKKEMWGLGAAASAIIAKDLFVQQGVKHVLVPGIGYGRNAKVFLDQGMRVTGIEISKTAIALAEKHFGTAMQIYHGSVTDMPFDDKLYDGIFCYGLIHLLDTAERAKLISDCYHQLAEGGYMVFTAISQKAGSYGKGKMVGLNRYELHEGAPIYFYDRQAIEMEFANAGLWEVMEIDENQPFFLVKCRK